MKVLVSIIALFATMAIAVPADAENGMTPANILDKLEKRGCGASCACLDGQCNCASCYPGGCNWYFNGKTC
jgi:hypothetical protein